MSINIRGMQKTSTIDYPGKLVATLFTVGCNLNCRYCHNSDLIGFDSFDENCYDIERILNFLKGRKNVLDGVCITGGEPTLQPELVDFVKKIKDIGMEVKLDTNGANPEVLRKLLVTEDLLDYIAMDIKTIGTESEIIGVSQNHPYWMRMHESFDLIEASKIDGEYRTTVVPGYHNEEIMDEIGRGLSGTDFPYYIQNFQSGDVNWEELIDENGFAVEQLNRFKEIMKEYIDEVYIRN